MKLFISTMTAALVLSACGKTEEVAPQPRVQGGGMSPQIAAIKSCMEEGLTEETCRSVHSQMMSGTLTGSPTTASCEAQYGVGKCGTVPVARSDGSSGSIILPLVAGAALGYLAHSMMASNSMPATATTPTRSWVNSRPAIYQQAVAAERTQARSFTSVTAPKPATQANSFVPKDTYSNKKVTINGQAPATGNTVPKPYVVPGAVTPEPAKPTAQANAVPAKTPVPYTPPATGYAQQQKAAPSPAPKVTYQSQPAPSRQSTTTSSSSGSSRRK